MKNSGTAAMAWTKCHSDWHATTSHHLEPRRTQTPCLRAPNLQSTSRVVSWRNPASLARNDWPMGFMASSLGVGARLVPCCFFPEVENLEPRQRGTWKSNGRQKVLVQNEKNGASRKIWPFALSHGFSRQRKPPKGVRLGNT